MSNLYRVATEDTLLSRSVGEVGVASLVGLFDLRTAEAFSEYFTQWARMRVSEDDVEPAIAMLLENGFIKEDEETPGAFILTVAGKRLVARYVKYFVQFISRDFNIITNEMRRELASNFPELEPDQEWIDWFLTEIPVKPRFPRATNEEEEEGYDYDR